MPAEVKPPDWKRYRHTGVRFIPESIPIEVGLDSGLRRNDGYQGRYDDCRGWNDGCRGWNDGCRGWNDGCRGRNGRYRGRYDSCRGRVDGARGEMIAAIRGECGRVG